MARPPPPPPHPLYLHEVPSTSTELRFLSTSDLRGPLSGRQEERTERWNSPMEKEAQRERKTDSAPKVAEKGGWIAHRESARKKDGQDTGMMGKGEERRTKETRRRKEFEGVGCRHRRGRCRFLPRCRRRRPSPRPPPPFSPRLLLLLLVLLLGVVVSSPWQADRILFSPFSNYR